MAGLACSHERHRTLDLAPRTSSFSSLSDDTGSQNEKDGQDDDDGSVWSDGETDERMESQGDSDDGQGGHPFMQVLQNREGKYSNHSMMYKSFHGYTVTGEGDNVLSKSEKGRAALEACSVERKSLQRDARTVGQRYKSVDLIEPLLASSPSSILYPIVAKDNEVLLRFRFIVKFPKRKDNQTPSATVVHGSGFPAAIRTFFDQVATDKRRAGLGSGRSSRLLHPLLSR